MMNKLKIFKSRRQNFREAVTINNNTGQHEFKDLYIEAEKQGTKIPFKHSFAMLCHMHDLRLWTISYAPSRTNNLQRLQELHRINDEALYLMQRALGQRIIAGIFLWFLICKIGKNTWLNERSKDSHDVSFRDNVATL